MTILEASYLALAAFAGAALNAVAGGGSFFTFPALIWSGLPVLNANATNTIALWPGAVSSAVSLRKKIGVHKGLLFRFLLVSILGSVLGTYLLIKTPDEVLRKLLPFLLLSATFILLLRSYINRISARQLSPFWAMLLQLAIAIYGGYFGGGIGILMLATFSLMGFTDLIQMNALKALLGSTINGVAVLLFIWLKVVYWSEALVMLPAAILGGYLGSLLLKRLNSVYLNRFIIALGFFLSLWFFFKEYVNVKS